MLMMERAIFDFVWISLEFLPDREDVLCEKY
jgi:hypothetical protein